MSEDEKNPVLRFFVHLTAGIGVSKVLNDFFRRNLIIKNKFDVLWVFAGTLVLTSMVTEQAAKHVEEKYQLIMTWWRKKREEFNEN